MPSTGATTALQQARASAPAGVDLWPTLTLAHPSWPTPYFLTNAPVAFTAKDENGVAITYQPFPFTVILPTVDGTGNQDLKISLTNADPLVADAVQLAHATPTQRITATYRLYLSSLGTTQTPQAPPLVLAFDSIQITEDAVSGTANRSDVLNRRFPSIWYDVAKFPGLDR